MFNEIAQKGKTICVQVLCVDWFYGFKLHLAINYRGEILDVALTPGNINDRKPVKKLLQRHRGKFYGDKGYISKALACELRAKGVVLITKFQKNMNNQRILRHRKNRTRTRP